MEKDRVISSFIKKVRKRLCRNIWVQSMLWAFLAGMLVWGIFNLIALFIPFYGAPLYGLLGFVITLVAGWIVAVKRYPNMRRTTLQIDSKGLKERVTTSYELAGKTDFYSELQKSDTIKRIQGIHIRKSFPLMVRKRVYAFLFLALIFTVTTAMFPAKSKEVAREQHELQEQIEEKADALEEIVEEFSKQYELTKEQQEALEELLADTIKELEAVEDYEQIAKVEERFQNKLKEQFQEPMNNYQEAKAIENAIQEKMENGMTEEARQELADAINDLQQQAKDQELQDLAEQIAQELEENGEISQETMERLEEYINDNYSQIGQPGQPGQGQQGQQGQNGQNQPGQGQQGQNGQNQQGQGQQGQNGQNQPGEGQQGQQGQNGQGQQGNQGQQGQQGGGNGSGSGWDEGSKYGTQEKGNSTGERVMVGEDDLPANETLNGQANADGDSNYVQSEQVFAWNGNAVEFSQVIGEYTNRAYNSLQNSNLPESMKSLIRDYFSGLNE